MAQSLSYYYPSSNHHKLAPYEGAIATDTLIGASSCGATSHALRNQAILEKQASHAINVLTNSPFEAMLQLELQTAILFQRLTKKHPSKCWQEWKKGYFNETLHNKDSHTQKWKP